MWPVAKSGKNSAPQEAPVCISEVHLRSRGPSGRSQDWETKAKRMRPPGPQRPENSAEPGPERPATQWQERKKMGSTSVETTGDRSVRALRRVPGAGGDMIDRPTEDVFASVADADNDPASP